MARPGKSTQVLRAFLNKQLQGGYVLEQSSGQIARATGLPARTVRWGVRKLAAAGEVQLARLRWCPDQNPIYVIRSSIGTVLYPGFFPWVRYRVLQMNARAGYELREYYNQDGVFGVGHGPCVIGKNRGGVLANQRPKVAGDPSALPSPPWNRTAVVRPRGIGGLIKAGYARYRIDPQRLPKGMAFLAPDGFMWLSRAQGERYRARRA